MSPRDFWEMTPQEVWWFLDAKRPVRMYGDMPEYVVEAIYREAYGDDDPED